MEKTDWITLGVGIGSIFATFVGAWVGAFFSGKYASKQSLSSLKLQQQYDRLQKEINETEENFWLLTRMSDTIKHLISTVNQTNQYIGSSLSNPQYLLDLKSEINILIEGLSSDRLKVTTKLQRRIINFEIKAKNLATTYEMLVSKKDDIELNEYGKRTLETFVNEASDILNKVDLEVDEMSRKLIRMKQHH